jgi:hypothetical protein
MLGGRGRRERAVAVPDACVSWRFAGLAAPLAAVGLAAVIAMAVALRRRELAIRAALGANRRRLRWLLLREAGRARGSGRGAWVGSAQARWAVPSPMWLIGVDAHDPLAMAAPSQAWRDWRRCQLVACASGRRRESGGRNASRVVPSPECATGCYAVIMRASMRPQILALALAFAGESDCLRSPAPDDPLNLVQQGRRLNTDGRQLEALKAVTTRRSR